MVTMQPPRSVADSVANVSRNARRARARRDLVASTEIPSSPDSVSRLSPSTYLRVSAVRYCSGRFATAMWTRSRVSARSSTSPGSGRSAIAANVWASVASIRSHAAVQVIGPLVGAQVIADHVARQHGEPAPDRAARGVVVGLPRQRDRERLLHDVLGERSDRGRRGRTRTRRGRRRGRRRTARSRRGLRPARRGAPRRVDFETAVRTGSGSSRPRGGSHTGRCHRAVAGCREPRRNSVRATVSGGYWS